MKDDALAVANLLERIGHLSRTDEKIGNLHPAQWAALRFFARANRFSRSPMALTRYLGTTRGTTSQTLMALDRKGCISRNQSERDKRVVEIELTKKGRSLLEDDPILHLVSTINSACGTSCKTLNSQLSMILRQLVLTNNGRMFGECRTCRHFRCEGGDRRNIPHYCGLLDVGLSDSDSKKICVEQEFE